MRLEKLSKMDAYYRLFLARIIVASITAVGVIGTIVYLDPVVGAVVAAFAALMVLSAPLEYRALGPRMRFWSDSYRPLAAEFVDNLQGMGTLKSFGAARRRGGELFDRAADVRDTAIKITNLSGVFWGLMAFAAGAGAGLSLAVGALRVADGAMTGRELLLTLLLAGECFLPVRQIHSAEAIRESFESSERTGQRLSLGFEDAEHVRAERLRQRQHDGEEQDNLHRADGGHQKCSGLTSAHAR